VYNFVAMRIGLLTGGGDCPGLNAAIRAVVKRAELEYGHTVVGFKGGWEGVVNGDMQTLTRGDVRNILSLGGTMLGTGRYHPDEHEGANKKIIDTLEDENIDALICIGGDGTTYAASRVAESGVKVVSIPKTIDNDVYGTEQSIGYETARNTATEAVDRLHTTAESHHRIMVVEVM
jgi:6-phosphofructokinase 1